MTDDYVFLDSRNGYRIGYKMEDGVGKWIAERNGVKFSITYDQARGYAPIDRCEALSMQIGRMLMKVKR